MKKILPLFLFLFASIHLFSQAPNPINWLTSYKAISATEGEITVTALIDKPWHTYSQQVIPDGPVPTTFSFTPNKQYDLIGTTQESKPEEEYVEAFGAKVLHFSDKAEFKQKVKISGKTGFIISFTVEYMCCDNKMCLPPKTVSLSVKTQ
jgi:Disulphide bond corrector protein DsbC